MLEQAESSGEPTCQSGMTAVGQDSLVGEEAARHGADLMRRYCAGEAAAFHELYRWLAPWLLDYVTGFCGDAAAAEALLRRTFLRFHRARGAYVHGANPIPWLYALARSTCLDEQRRRGADGDRPEETHGERAGKTMGPLSQLPEHERDALLLTQVHGRSLAEAAAISGATVGAVKRRIHRGSQTLRKVPGGSSPPEEGQAPVAEASLLAAELPAPPPAAALLARVGAARAARTRQPGLALLLMASAAAALPLFAVSQYPLRADLDALPGWWFLPAALVWLAGFLVPLTVALRPPRGQVLPDVGRAGRLAVLTALGLVALGLVTYDAPGRTIIPASTWADFSRAWWPCFSFGLSIVAPALLAAALALGRVLSFGAARLGAAVGAAGGALGGLTLHALCPVGGVLHVVAAHAGPALVGALLGALAFTAVSQVLGRVPGPA